MKPFAFLALGAVAAAGGMWLWRTRRVRQAKNAKPVRRLP